VLDYGGIAVGGESGILEYYMKVGAKTSRTKVFQSSFKKD